MTSTAVATKRALTVFRPKNDGDEPCSGMMPGRGNLENCRGTASPPDSSLSSAGVHMLALHPDDDDPSEEDLLSSLDVVFPDSFHRWNYDNMLEVAAEPAPSQNNNKVFFGAFWVDGFGMPQGADITEKVFKGIGGLPSEPPSGHDEAGPPPLQHQVSPSGVDEFGWMMYRHLSVDLFGLGNVLTHDGTPLKASQLAVSAFDVFWQRDDRPGAITQPDGDALPNSSGWFFRDVPESAIVIWQGDKRTRHVVTSQAREEPVIADLDPAKPIFVQVNHLWKNRRRGAFSLWARVLE